MESNASKLSNSIYMYKLRENTNLVTDAVKIPLKVRTEWPANAYSYLRVGDKVSLYKDNLAGKEITVRGANNEVWLDNGSIDGDEWTIEAATNGDSKAISFSNTNAAGAKCYARHAGFVMWCHTYATDALYKADTSFWVS